LKKPPNATQVHLSLNGDAKTKRGAYIPSLMPSMLVIGNGVVSTHQPEELFQARFPFEMLVANGITRKFHGTCNPLTEAPRNGIM